MTDGGGTLDFLYVDKYLDVLLPPPSDHQGDVETQEECQRQACFFKQRSMFTMTWISDYNVLDFTDL
jgi:hypothetical protein